MLVLPGGRVRLGAGALYPEETPEVEVAVAPFAIDRTEVTNRQFAAFVAATGHVTVAERSRDGGAVFTIPHLDAERLAATGWWQLVAGADWRHPEGPGSSIAGREDDPVVQIAYADALAYARWRGNDLPTEAEWEYAARGGLVGQRYAWGDQTREQVRANTWQGFFPFQNTAADGFSGRAPVGCFEPNGYGLYDMIGNVWEWTADTYVDQRRADVPMHQPGPAITIKGGSFLCSPDFCARFRPAARQGQEAEFTTNHIGFRTVRRPSAP
ncbi:formylglycine-generating enzyme family protein [Oleisolibacter albus]|uniref:formylglycine-generating enzyme family protein n=1 Tax=Oleisolibacter albus TaxID=2171757 RepID=UPI001960AB88|nr:formylglycine-generating enzyme family protein [Oleisolibacter albus]